MPQEAQIRTGPANANATTEVETVNEIPEPESAKCGN